MTWRRQWTLWSRGAASGWPTAPTTSPRLRSLTGWTRCTAGHRAGLLSWVRRRKRYLLRWWSCCQSGTSPSPRVTSGTSWSCASTRQVYGNLLNRRFVDTFLGRHAEFNWGRQRHQAHQDRSLQGEGDKVFGFDILAKSAEGVPAENMYNSNQTNLLDDPGNQKCLFKKITHYCNKKAIHIKTGKVCIFSNFFFKLYLIPYRYLYLPYHTVPTHYWMLFQRDSLIRCWIIFQFNQTKSVWYGTVLFCMTIYGLKFCFSHGSWCF